MKSTKLRNSPNHWSLIIAQKIEETIAEVDKIRNHSTKLQDLVQLGFAVKGEQLWESAEYEKLANDLDPEETCPRFPPDIEVAVGTERTQVHHDEVVSKNNRFGRCKSNKQCLEFTADTTCSKNLTRWGFSQGRCRCARNHCYAFDHKTGRGKCVSEKSRDDHHMTIQAEIAFRSLEDFEENFKSQWMQHQIQDPWSIELSGTETREWFEFVDHETDIIDPSLQDQTGEPNIAHMEGALTAFDANKPIVMTIEHGSIFRWIGEKIDQRVHQHQIQIGSFIKRLDQLSLKAAEQK